MSDIISTMSVFLYKRRGELTGGNSNMHRTKPFPAEIACAVSIDERSEVVDVLAWT
jgi:hypothetical protein